MANRNRYAPYQAQTGDGGDFVGLLEGAGAEGEGAAGVAASFSAVMDAAMTRTKKARL